MITPPRVALSKSTTGALKQIAARTGLSPNLVARFAMLISFEQDFEPVEDHGPSDLTINASSLFGEIEPFLMSAFAFRAGKLEKATSAKVLSAHIARGAAFLNVRVDSIVDLARMCSH